MVNDEQRPEDKSADGEHQSREPTAAESHASEISSEPSQTPADDETRTQAAPAEPADDSHASEVSSDPLQTPADDETRTQAVPAEPEEPAKDASAPEVELGEARLAAGTNTNGTSGEAAPAAAAETAELADGAPAAAPSSAHTSKEGEMETAAPRTPWVALLVSGLVGGALVAVAGYAWLSNRLDEGATNVLLARVGAVELAVRDLSAAGGQLAAESQDATKLAERLAKLEAGIADVAKSAQAAPDPALANRLTALEAVAKSLTDQLVRLDRRAGETESALQAVSERGAADGEAPAAVVAPKPPEVTKAEFGMLSDRVGTLQKALTSLQQNPQPRTGGGVVDDRAALTVVTAGLRDAVERGTAFAGELKAAKALGADAQQIAPLEAFAASGVPSAAALGRELAKLAPDMMPAGSGLSRDASYIDRLQAQAERLVRFRPVGGAPGQDVVAVVSRIEAKAKRADIAGALAEIRELPETARAPAEPWIKKAEARAAAIAAAQNLEAAALAALAANP